MVAEGDKVVVRWTLRGKHEGTTRTGRAPTGERVSGTGIDTLRIVDGRILEAWVNLDYFGVMQQMGAIPAPEQRRAAT